MSKPKPFNNPFSQLKLTKDDPAPSVPAAKKGPNLPTRAGQPPRRESPPKANAQVDLESERALFLQSVGEVATQVKKGRPRPEAPVQASRPEEDEDVLAQLTELISGDAPFWRSEPGEPVAGCITHLDRSWVQRLQSGATPVDASVDLEGLTEPKGKARLETFLVESRHQKARCVRVIPGRQAAEVGGWLSRGRSGRQVLAFAEVDGAVDVLLRR